MSERRRLMMQTANGIYRDINYIESNGTQFINTLFWSNQRFKYVMVCSITDITAVQRLSGFYNSYMSKGIEANSNFNCYRYSNQNSTTSYSWIETDIQLDTNEHTFTCDYISNKISIDDYSYNLTNYYNTNKRTLLTIFCLNNYKEYDETTPSPNLFAYMRLKSYKLYDANGLVRDFVPKLRLSDNKPGLLDVVNNIFYTNNGTGEFTYA